jgi:hypothetical protein
MVSSNLFRSFWIAGFESACHINSHGLRVDMITATQHDTQADTDYELASGFNMRTSREGVRWHLVDRCNGYDFSPLVPMLDAARRHGFQVIWNLLHYGWPDGLDIFSPAFIDRFARYAAAVTRFLQDETGEVPFLAPVNEISFFSYAGARFMYPYAAGRDNELKAQLVRAAVAGADAILSVAPEARLIWSEPLIHVVAPLDRPELASAAAAYTESQFEAWDMISGRRCPELGGNPRYLDITAVNFYHDNQWELEGEKLRWDLRPLDKRYIPFHRLIARVYERYRRPLFIGETSHIGVGRGRWIRELGQEVCRAIQLGVPLEGVCLYPIIDRPDWEDPRLWHHAGLWDLRRDRTGRLRRILAPHYASGLRYAQSHACNMPHRTRELLFSPK